jgi:hypothetical protein
MTAPQPLPSRLIGALFVERGLVSESQIRIALEIQNETGQQLGQILVERFGVSRKELASVVAEQWAKLGGSAGPEDTASWRRLGEIFVDRGFVTQDELDQALARQRQTGERLGEALVAQGVISKFELAGALAEQMAALESESEALESPTAEATVHQLPTRPDEPSDAIPAAVLELVPSEEHGSGSVEPSDASTNGSEPHAAEELDPELADDDDQEHAEAGVADEADEPSGITEVQPVDSTSDADLEEEMLADEVGVVEPEPVVADVTFAEPVGDELDVAEPGSEDVAIAEPAGDDLGVVEPPVDDIVGEEPAAACVAFAPTTKGYRLVPLDVVPSAGETIDVPDVGPRLVLRVGRSPYPLDHRTCAFVEEPVIPAPPAELAATP